MQCKYAFILIVFFGLCALVPVTNAQAQQFAAPTDPLKTCQEQLADVRGAVKEIILPNAAFQAETLFTLNRRLAEAMQQHTQDAATIETLHKELAALRRPISITDTPASSTAKPARP